MRSLIYFHVLGDSRVPISKNSLLICEDESAEHIHTLRFDEKENVYGFSAVNVTRNLVLHQNIKSGTLKILKLFSSPFIYHLNTE